LIAIVNISPEYGKGRQLYEVRINREVKAVFWHNYKDGLAVCLRKASEAVKTLTMAEDLQKKFQELEEKCATAIDAESPVPPTSTK
jgi:hypothetical protein